jgi:hypothetical protein
MGVDKRININFKCSSYLGCNITGCLNSISDSCGFASYFLIINNTLAEQGI